MPFISHTDIVTVRTPRWVEPLPLGDTAMRDDITINSTVKQHGTSWALPITKAEKEILGIEPGDDLEIKILVRERKPRNDQRS